MTSFTLDYLLKGLSHIWSCWGLGLQCMNLGGGDTVTVYSIPGIQDIHLEAREQSQGWEIKWRMESQAIQAFHKNGKNCLWKILSSQEGWGQGAPWATCWQFTLDISKFCSSFISLESFKLPYWDEGDCSGGFWEGGMSVLLPPSARASGLVSGRPLAWERSCVTFIYLFIYLFIFTYFY